MIETIRNFMQDRFSGAKERGASAVEYGLLIAGIAALVIVAIFALGPVVAKQFDDTCESIQSGGTTDGTGTCAPATGGGV